MISSGHPETAPPLPQKQQGALLDLGEQLPARSGIERRIRWVTEGECQSQNNLRLKGILNTSSAFFKVETRLHNG